jgi:hypothetical protein
MFAKIKLDSIDLKAIALELILGLFLYFLIERNLIEIYSINAF